MGLIPATVFVYKVSRPDKNGETTVIEKWIGQAMDMQAEWATKNHNNAAAIEQAAKDKHLFYHVPRQRHIELKYPEYVFTLPGVREACDADLLDGQDRWFTVAPWLTRDRTFGHGSPYNVPAGHYVNMDKVVAHYNQKHLAAEERKAKKLAAASE